MIAVALLAYTVRVYGYTLLTQRTYKMVLVLEALHGFTFASMWTATVAIADEISPVPTPLRPPIPPFAPELPELPPLLGVTTAVDHSLDLRPVTRCPPYMPALPSGTPGL